MSNHSAVFVLSLMSCVGAAAQQTLPGTAPLRLEGDLAALMVDGINEYLEEKSAQSVEGRAAFWKRDYASGEAYGRSVEPNRQRLRKILGVVDDRLPADTMKLEMTLAAEALVAQGKGFKAFAVRWPVFPGVDGAGLLLEPDGDPVARVVALPDADWSPEMLAGLTPGLEPAAQFARRLAENGCQVIIPVLIDRRHTWSGVPSIRMTNQPHREYVYRMAFEVGRHIIGYEVQKTLAAVDWFARMNRRAAIPVAVAGYGEGGLVAMYAAALDARIGTTLVSGYFQPREGLWREPVYRDVWALLKEFGDAEVAGLIAPRALIVEASRHPEIAGPPAETADRKGATPNGRLTTPAVEAVEKEVARARPYFAGLRAEKNLQLVKSEAPGSEAALAALVGKKLRPGGAVGPNARTDYDPAPRMREQFQQLVDYTQDLMRQSPQRREEFWKKADASSAERWKESTKFYRDYIWDEVIGRMPPPGLPANARTRLLYDEPKFRGYEVVLDVWPKVFASGILLVPRGIRDGERRPVVVCQHGLEGRPVDLADPKVDHRAYHRYAVRLAEEGFVVYAPQNPYIGEDRFRIIQRKGHPLKLALFSFILGQHERTLEWLGGLPFVDRSRIGFYGLSYGGKTAVRVPPLLDGYALSICSADFNEWVWKTTSVEARFSYMFTREYDMLEFDFANVVNYGELANLMAPRPFMVERGHDDGVSSDEWVAYEYAKVRRFYNKLGLGDRAAIEFFDGPHTIHGVGTFEFLRRHLRWPR